MQGQNELAPPGRSLLGISERHRCESHTGPSPDPSPAVGIETASSCVSPSPSELIPYRATHRHPCSEGIVFEMNAICKLPGCVHLSEVIELKLHNF